MKEMDVLHNEMLPWQRKTKQRKLPVKITLFVYDKAAIRTIRTVNGDNFY